MSLYAAIDLHSSNSVLAVMDGDGKPVLGFLGIAGYDAADGE